MTLPTHTLPTHVSSDLMSLLTANHDALQSLTHEEQQLIQQLENLRERQRCLYFARSFMLEYIETTYQTSGGDVIELDGTITRTNQPGLTPQPGLPSQGSYIATADATVLKADTVHQPAH